METLWERRSDALDGSSISIERAETASPLSHTGATMTFLLLVIGWRTRTRLAYVGLLRSGRWPIGVAALVGGRLRQWWAG